MSQDKNIAHNSLAANRKVMETITLLFCFISDGSEKCEILLIGKSTNPRTFHKKCETEF